MHIDESLLAHVEDTRRFNEQYMAAMAASPLGFATAEDALRTRAVLDAAVAPLPPDRLQPQVLHVGAAEPAVEVRVFVPERPQGVCIQFHIGRLDHRLGPGRRRPQRRDRRAVLGGRGQRRVPDGARGTCRRPSSRTPSTSIDWVRTDGRQPSSATGRSC